MKATIVIIGDEILLGRVTDTNSGFIARALDPLDIAIERIVTVGDNADQITRAVSDALTSTPLVITTGGLGPTKDDITKHVLMSVFGGELVFDPTVYANVQRIFAAKNLDMNRLTHDQALVPTSCRVIQNIYGTAPVMWFADAEGRVLVALPGVPHEACQMMSNFVVGEIATHFSPHTHYTHRSLQVSGISESGLAECLAAWEDSLPAGFHLAYLPNSPVITLRLDGRGTDSAALATQADYLFAQLRELLGTLIIAVGEAPLSQTLVDSLRRHKLTLCTAESCTGGNIARSITQVAGCSDVFNGAIVSYSNAVKEHLLAVPAATLSAHGAVSAQTVAAMLAGACRATGSQCCMATSGIAGPGGGTAEKPVGTVWIGAFMPGRDPVIECHHFSGSRQRIIDRATATAQLTLLRLLQDA